MGTWVHDLAASADPSALAIIDHDGARWTYRDLGELAKRLEQAFAAHGIRGGDRVMLVAENCAAFVGSVLALSRIAAWAVPLNARHSTEELRAIRDHCEARCMVFFPVVSEPSAGHAASFSTDAAIENGTILVGPVRDSQPEPVAQSPQDRTAALLYTTGTTSAPKGVMLSHGNVCWGARASQAFRGMTADDEVIGVLPFSHVFGFASTMLATLSANATLRCMPRFTPEAVLQAFAEGASVLPAVPQTFERILTHLATTGSPLIAPRRRFISAGGAPLDPDLKERAEALFGLPLGNGYGMTETTAGIAATTVLTPRGDLSVGPSLPGASLSIDALDKDGVGELIAEGPNVMQGYYRNAEATSAVMPRPGVFRTGDLGRIDPDGAVHVVGRSKELIIRSGFNVYPPEIEAMLTRHPDVLQAAVVPRPVKGNEEIAAFVMAKNGLEATTLAEWLRPRLTTYKQPQHLILVAGYPTAPTGKILKHKLLSTFAEQLTASDAARDAQ